MNNNDLNLLTNDLMTAFLDDSPSSIVGSICRKYRIEVGGKVFTIASNRVIDWLENKEYKLLSDYNRTKLTMQGLKNMEKLFDMQLGVNYSMSNGGMVMSKVLSDKIRDAEPRLWEEMVNNGQVKTLDQSSPYIMLERLLGVPFFDSLLSIVKLRILTLDDVEAASYLEIMVRGMYRANIFLDDDKFIYKLLDVCDDRAESIVEQLSSNFEMSNSVLFYVLDDLLTALGRPERHVMNGEAVMGVDDMVSLDRVWWGENYRPAIVADALRKADRNNRQGGG